jgi:hypothetical protein
MNLCAGIALLSFCFPLPGAPRAALEESGWHLSQYGKDGLWAGSSWLAVDSYRLVTQATGETELQTLILAEPKNAEFHKLNELLDAHCGKQKEKDTIRVCYFSKKKLYVSRCMGGWAFKKKPMDEMERARCKQYESLFDTVLSTEPSKDAGVVHH